MWALGLCADSCLGNCADEQGQLIRCGISSLSRREPWECHLEVVSDRFWWKAEWRGYFGKGTGIVAREAGCREECGGLLADLVKIFHAGFLFFSEWWYW